jgi:hypothetical protein
MNKEAYREIRLYPQVGLCDCFDNPLNREALRALIALAHAQFGMQLNLEQIEETLKNEQHQSMVAGRSR